MTLTRAAEPPPLLAPPPPRPRSVLAAVAAVAVLTTAGCALADLDHVRSRDFDRRADAPVRGDLAFVLPSFVPQDATDITVRVRTDRTDARMYRWESPSGTLPADCQADSTSGPGPFEPSAWPADALSSPGWACGPVPIHIHRVQDTFYAW